MKTFKLVDLKLRFDEEKEAPPEEIPLIDGLVVNREDGENSWLIEALIPDNFQSYFQTLLDADEKKKVFVTISKKTNAPAQILARVKTITPLEPNISILLDGRLLTSRPVHDPAELLQTLMEQGLAKEGLMVEFKKRMQERKETTKL
ncbi:YwpF family protein [Bacillus weihaiensis]|uniref:YwpF-like protein n=1 Tax=Bacillus weihaiensis TaxID=1547283 RepID=A0A1L3MM46_9BACI|nr:YwpF family protein [Bacillus weihaiensis]APH03425.1 hypothetical protein A9C19_00885 [Bacillus weihaiensis]